MSRRTRTAAAAELPTESPTDTTLTQPGEEPAGNPADTILSGGSQQAEERPNVARASILSDSLAGMTFTFDYERHQAEIAFKDIPGTEVRALLRDNGFDWDRENKVWHRPIRYQQREQDRLISKRTFHQAAGMVRKEKGIEPANQPLPD